MDFVEDFPAHPLIRDKVEESRQDLHPQVVSKKTDYVIVAFYDNQKITRIHKSKIEPLGEHVGDKQRAVNDLAAYSDALADQIYGVE